MLTQMTREQLSKLDPTQIVELRPDSKYVVVVDQPITQMESARLRETWEEFMQSDRKVLIANGRISIIEIVPETKES